ncbi:MAG: type II secretion system protein [Armatimonadota bacterium]
MNDTHRKNRGFTLVELLVVIGIAVILMGIMVSVGRSLREGNAATSCQAQLQNVGTALRAYFLDEGGVPPYTIPGTVDSPDYDYEIDFSAQRGLLSLYDLGYIGSEETFHCPRDVEAQKGTPEYFYSYLTRDPAAKADYDGTEIGLNRYKYMPHRWVLPDDEDFVDRRRQLDIYATETTDVGGNDVLIVGPTGGVMPDDTTIVTWCNAHAESHLQNGVGQYIVLFWDGSVRQLDAPLFRDEEIGPPAAWQVEPGDIAH